MIPRKIHYCWFGGKPLPKSAVRCIDSWKKHFPGWEIIEWNESNFDIDAIPYTREAASAGKWAFVSDYARFLILYHHGGVYFDTDVEVIRPMEDLIDKGAFMGFEKSHAAIGVNPGLGISTPVKHPFYHEVITLYSKLHYTDENGIPFPGTVVTHITNLLLEHGLKLENTRQHIAGIDIYPNDYFNPLDDATGVLNATPNTRSIHHYAKTWCDNYGPVRTFVMRRLHRLFGVTFLSRLKAMLLKAIPGNNKTTTRP